RTPRRNRPRRSRQEARPDGVGRLPPPVEPPRRRGRLPGYLPRPRPQGGVHPVEGDGGELAVRGRPPDGFTGTEDRRPTEGEGRAGDGDARSRGRATGPMAGIAAAAGRGAESPAGNLPSGPRPLRAGGQEPEGDRPPARRAGRDRGRAAGKG